MAYIIICARQMEYHFQDYCSFLFSMRTLMTFHARLKYSPRMMMGTGTMLDGEGHERINSRLVEVNRAHTE